MIPRSVIILPNVDGFADVRFFQPKNIPIAEKIKKGPNTKATEILLGTVDSAGFLMSMWPIDKHKTYHSGAATKKPIDNKTCLYLVMPRFYHTRT